MYEVHLDKRDHDAAESQCNKDGGHLAYFNDEQEYKYVVKELTKIGESTGVIFYYIGEINFEFSLSICVIMCDFILLFL